MADNKASQIIQKQVPNNGQGIVEKKLGLETYSQPTNNGTPPTPTSTPQQPTPKSVNETNSKKGK